jgi:hypothetical protein
MPVTSAAFRWKLDEVEAAPAYPAVQTQPCETDVRSFFVLPDQVQF